MDIINLLLVMQAQYINIIKGSQSISRATSTYVGYSKNTEHDGLFAYLDCLFSNTFFSGCFMSVRFVSLFLCVFYFGLHCNVVRVNESSIY